jgi:monofunctional biosynthetic peptidoglycan transglycosylase
MKPSSPRGKPAAYRIGWFIGRAIIWFVVISILWVLVLKWVPAPPTFTMLTDEHGWTRDWEPLERIDRNMVRAIIAAEDSKFCSHSGFDTDAIADAMRRNASGSGRMRGGSTISQQVAKNVFLWHGSGAVSRFIRKAPEAWFTLLIETVWGKRRIMEIYLNVAETGIGTYGVAAGAQRYFGHGADELSRVEAARIAAVLPAPQRRGAISPRGFTRRYGNSIAARMRIVERDGLDGCVYPRP